MTWGKTRTRRFMHGKNVLCPVGVMIFGLKLLHKRSKQWLVLCCLSLPWMRLSPSRHPKKASAAIIAPHPHPPISHLPLIYLIPSSIKQFLTSKAATQPGSIPHFSVRNTRRRTQRPSTMLACPRSHRSSYSAVLSLWMIINGGRRQGHQQYHTWWGWWEQVCFWPFVSSQWQPRPVPSGVGAILAAGGGWMWASWQQQQQQSTTPSNALLRLK